MENAIFSEAMPKIKLTLDEINKSEAHALGLLNKKSRAEQKQVDPDKYILDTSMGKKAEFAAAHYLEQCGYSWVEPDCAIYAQNTVGFTPDLIYGDTNIHVKSVRIDSYFGISFNCSINDAIFYAPNPADYICAVIADDSNNEYSIFAIVNSLFAKYNELWLPPLMSKFNATKRFMYKDILIYASSFI
jgi:hypothetical protein